MSPAQRYKIIFDVCVTWIDGKYFGFFTKLNFFKIDMPDFWRL